MSFTDLRLWVEVVGAVFGVVGTLLLARKGSWAGWGFVMYLASNTAWIAWAVQRESWPMLIQQLVFFVSSVYGIWVWLIQPRLKRDSAHEQ